MLMKDLNFICASVFHQIFATSFFDNLKKFVLLIPQVICVFEIREK